MFKHRGRARTFRHNLKLASLLSFVAGIVNVTGFFAIQRLTTNVTGHFAFFADEVIKKNYGIALIYLMYILSFFAGAFFSNMLVEIITRRNQRFANIFPLSIEIVILLAVAIFGKVQPQQNQNIIACILLFAMGLQNSLVTSISNSVVRTTHLTGLFTDLGIELSQLFFYKRPEQIKKLISSIKLRFAIIGFFFVGCLTGGYGYFMLGMLNLLPAAIILIVALIYDSLRFAIITFKRKYLN